MAQPNPQDTNLFQPSLTVLDGRNVQLKNPWRRYFAKMVDNVVVGLSCIPCFLVLAMGVAILFNSAEVPEGIYTILIILLFAISSIIYDGILLATWGTTLGKKLLGLQVTDQAGNKLSWEKSFNRSVWVNGLLSICELIPILLIVLMVYQKQRLCRTGFTSWDEAEQTLVYRI